VDGIAELYRILPVDGRACRIWARLMHHQPAALGLDALIAATAIVHDLTVVTRNVQDPALRCGYPRSLEDQRAIARGTGNLAQASA
jgi:predicted nucleic acid-binding protein